MKSNLLSSIFKSPMPSKRTVTILLCYALVLTGCSNTAINNSPGPNNRHLTVQSPPKIMLSPASSSQDTANYLSDFIDENAPIYQLRGSEIYKEINKLNPKKDPTSQLQLALLLARTHSPADSQKALNLLSRLITQEQTADTPQATLARLFYPLVEEQHKTNTQLTQQNKTIKENGQEINSLRNKLNALRAIEDDLSTRPAESAPHKPE